MRSKKIVASLIFGMAASPLVHATNGMNLEGYGPVASSMGGASMAYDNGTAAVMNNPATLGLMSEGSHVDFALGLLAPSISASIPAMAGMVPPVDSSANAFYMPAMGYAKKTGNLTYGVGVFSQGGMGTEYDRNSFMAAGSGQRVRSEVGVGRFIMPLAYQEDKFTVGGSLDYVWAGMDLKMALPGTGFMDMLPAAMNPMATQTYGSVGGSMLTAFGGMMPNLDPANPMNWARVDFSDSSRFTGQAKGGGFAFKLGGTYKVNGQLTLGASYHSKTAISDLKSSAASMSMNVNMTGMGAVTVPISGNVSVNNFQWPMTVAMGAAFQANDDLLLVADYKRIAWKDVMKDFKMTFNADANQANPMAAGLASTSIDMTMKQNWDDQNVIQLGAAYKTSKEITVRGGVNLANNPVPNKYMNPLFPAIAKNHVTLGMGYMLTHDSNFDISYAYVPKESVTNGQGVKVDFGGYSIQALYSLTY